MVVDRFTFNGQDSIYYSGVKSAIFATQNKARAYVFGWSANATIKFTKQLILEGVATYTTGKYTDKTKSYVTRTAKDRITTDPGGFDDTTASNLSIFTSVRSEDPTKVISTIDGQTNFAGGENTLVGTTPEVTIPGFNSSFS